MTSYIFESFMGIYRYQVISIVYVLQLTYLVLTVLEKKTTSASYKLKV